MKERKTIPTLIVASGLALWAGGCATSPETLARSAKVSRTQAEQTALTRVVGGTITKGELEKEHGRLVWSFDLATPGTRNVTEVQIDAIQGQVVSVETELP